MVAIMYTHMYKITGGVFLASSNSTALLSNVMKLQYTCHESSIYTKVTEVYTQMGRPFL